MAVKGPHNPMQLQIVSKLAYSWTGWPNEDRVPKQLPDKTLNELILSWKSDGMRWIDSKWSVNQCQFTFLAEPFIAPVVVTRKTKGRLVHALRELGYRNCFQRKVSLRSLGDNITDTVQRYVATQLDRSELADSKYIHQLDSLKYTNKCICLKNPRIVTHGRYWINMHLVLVVAGRYRIRGGALLKEIRKFLIEWGAERLNPNQQTEKSGAAGIRSFSIMPDHLHLVIRAPIEQSPEVILEDLWQRLNARAGFYLYSDEVYVGTFSEYSIGAIKRVDW